MFLYICLNLQKVLKNKNGADSFKPAPEYLGRQGKQAAFVSVHWKKKWG
jgi:hypothetical protein